MTTGGSPNAVLHLLAIAYEAGVELSLDDFNRIADKVPHIADTKPGGKYHMSDMHRIGGVPVGRDLADTLLACTASADPGINVRFGRRCAGFEVRGERFGEALPLDGVRAQGLLEEAQGSMIIVVATDAPLLPHQLKRMATRVSVGVGRQGGFGGNSSGDIFIAFSTANPRAWQNDGPVTDIKMLPNDRITPLFQATAQATEAAITNALLAAETTTGANDLRVYAMPVDGSHASPSVQRRIRCPSRSTAWNP